MSNKTRYTTSRRLAMTAAASALLGFGTIAPMAQATSSAEETGTQALILAGTVGMERRQDNREERRDDRGDRRDNRQDCRDEEGVVGKDKRDCKQEGRQENREEARND